MVGFSGISARIGSLLLDALYLLVLQAALDIEELLGVLVLLGMANHTHSRVPGRLLSAQKVTVDLVLNTFDHVLDLRVVRVSIIVPSGENSLIARIILLTVMSGTDLDLGLQVVLLRQGAWCNH